MNYNFFYIFEELDCYDSSLEDVGFAIDELQGLIFDTTLTYTASRFEHMLSQTDQWLANFQEGTRDEIENRLVLVIWRLQADGVAWEPKSDSVAKKLEAFTEEHKND